MTPITAEHRISVTAGTRAPGEARRWLAEQLSGRKVPDRTTDDALLVLSELVTNAVRHGRPEVDVMLTVLPDRLRIAVRDRGEALPVFHADPVAATRAGGRGLLIVAATAVDWGVSADGTSGKTVWADLALG